MVCTCTYNFEVVLLLVALGFSSQLIILQSPIMIHDIGQDNYRSERLTYTRQMATCHPLYELLIIRRLKWITLRVTKFTFSI